MAASGSQTIQLYYSTTSGTAPVAGNLASGEIAININDGKLYYKDSGGTVQLLASKAAASGSFSDITASGNVTLSGGTANGVAYLNGSKVLTTGSALTFDGTTFSLSGGAITSTDSAGNARSKFEVFTNGQTNNQITLGQGFAGPTDNVGYLYNRANAAFVFGVNNSEQMRLTSTGLGIGTSSPGARLDAQSATSTEVRATATSAAGSGNYAGFRAVNGGGAAAIFGSGTTAGSYSYTGELANAAFVGSFGSNPLQFVTNSVARATLDSSGNLGLGVTPSAWNSAIKALQIGAGVSLESRTSNYGYMALSANQYINSGGTPIYLATDAATKYEQANGVHRWSIAPSGTAGSAISFTQAMTLDASGNLLVGTTGNTYSAKSVFYSSGGYTLTSQRTGTSSEGHLIFQNANGAVGTISTNGSATTYATSSDYRLKENIQPMAGALAKVQALKPCTYNWKADGSDGEGFIAHELAEIFPGAVTGEKDAVDAEGKPVYQGIDTSFLVATLAAAIQEQQAIITALTERIAALEAK